jgi:hypothetical protein
MRQIISYFGSTFIYYLQSSGDFVHHRMQSAAAGCDNITSARAMTSFPASDGRRQEKEAFTYCIQ